MANIVFGRSGVVFGNNIVFAGNLSITAVVPDDPIRDNAADITLYDRQGHILARFGDDIQNNPLISLEFAQNETGCGEFTLVLGFYPPGLTEIPLGTRIDVHLYADAQPWYSGYVIERPAPGSTKMPLEFTGYGFYDQLDKQLINKTYEGVDIAAIVRDIVRTIEPQCDIKYRDSKIYNVGYNVGKLEFVNATAKEAIEQLVEFAANYVCGVDQYRELYFMPVNNDINEKARFWVGKHLSEFEPQETLDDMLNYVVAKGGLLDSEEGENVTRTAANAASIAQYGRRAGIVDTPFSMTAADIQRYADMQVTKLKDPRKYASIENASMYILNYDGTINPRKLFVNGLARIVSEDGQYVYDYPISEIKYELSASGLRCDMELGDTKKPVERWFVRLQRDAANAEALGAANTKQLSGG